MSERLSDQHLRAMTGVGWTTEPQTRAMADELLPLRARVAELEAAYEHVKSVMHKHEESLTIAHTRVAKLEAALKDIANTYDDSWHAGSQERRIGDEARAALKDAPQ